MDTQSFDYEFFGNSPVAKVLEMQVFDAQHFARAGEYTANSAMLDWIDVMFF